MDYKVLKYRSSHPKCKYCKYLRPLDPPILEDGIYFECLAKDKLIYFPDIIRICSCYDIEGGVLSGKRNTLDRDHVLSLCEDPNSNLIPSLKAQDAVNELCRHFLGEDWYDDTSAQTNGQVNFDIVCEIESNYKGSKTKKKR